jgi:aminobenzoyl-glutamate utilization protein B
MDIGWNFRREHLRLQQRSHMVFTNGGSQPNVVPPTASAWYYFREIDYPHIKEMWETGNKVARAAAMMTDTEVSWRLLGAAWPQHMNRPVAAGDPGQHRPRRTAAVGRSRPGVRQSRPEDDEVA